MTTTIEREGAMTHMVHTQHPCVACDSTQLYVVTCDDVDATHGYDALSEYAYRELARPAPNPRRIGVVSRTFGAQSFDTAHGAQTAAHAARAVTGRAWSITPWGTLHRSTTRDA